MISEGIAAKIAGTFSGTILALVFIPPRTRAGFVRRGLAAFVFGGAFGHLPAHYLNWSLDSDYLLSSYTGTAFASWWLMGAIKRAAESPLLGDAIKKLLGRS